MKSFLQRAQGTSITLHAGSFTIPMDLSRTFDTVFAIFVVQEEPEPSQLFREIALLLKPGRTLFYTEPPFIVSIREVRDNLTLAARAGHVPVETRLPEPISSTDKNVRSRTITPVTDANMKH